MRSADPEPLGQRYLLALGDAARSDDVLSSALAHADDERPFRYGIPLKVFARAYVMACGHADQLEPDDWDDSAEMYAEGFWGQRKKGAHA